MGTVHTTSRSNVGESLRARNWRKREQVEAKLRVMQGDQTTMTTERDNRDVGIVVFRGRWQDALKRKQGFGPGNADEALGRSLLSSGWMVVICLGEGFEWRTGLDPFLFFANTEAVVAGPGKVGAETGGPTATVEDEDGWKAVDGG